MASGKKLLTRAWNAAVDRARAVPGTRPEIWQESIDHSSPYVRVVLVNLDDGQPYEMSPRLRVAYVSLYRWAVWKYGGKTPEEKREAWRKAKKKFDRIMGARINMKKGGRKEVPAEAPIPPRMPPGPKPGFLKSRSEKQIEAIRNIAKQPLTE